MRVALISYHKCMDALYPKAWIERHRKSVLNQTYKDFDIYELNYGGGEERIFDQKYESKEFPTFIHAMNYLLDFLFYDIGYDAVANLNCDDWYDKKRLEIQLPFISQGFDIVSSNFALIRREKEFLRHRFHQMDIEEQLNKGNNIVAHPAVIYSKNFWKNMRYNPEEIPFEDMKLWKRALMMGHRIKIVEECLLFHTIHENSVCRSNNR